jgi:hypothetical protein
MQDSGKPEDAGTAKPEDAGTEATRETISRRQGKEDLGKPETLNPRQSRKVRYAGKLAATPGGATGLRCPGETQSASNQGCRRTRDSGRLEYPSPVQPEDAGTGETREIIDRRNQKSKATGQLGAYALDVLKDARFGVTRRSIAGKAGRRRSQGDPATRRQAQLE